MRSFHSTLDCECDVARRLPRHNGLGTGTVSYNKLSLSDFLSGHFISASDMKLETLGRWSPPVRTKSGYGALKIQMLEPNCREW